jgi:uncharacterized membrane protein YeaQ/YmgE (transglycosylase-associated protein family)
MVDAMFGLVLWIAFGILAGSVARFIMPGPNAGGLAVAIPLSILGAIIGGGIGALLGPASAGVDIRALLLAIAVSLGFLFLYRSYALRTES